MHSCSESMTSEPCGKPILTVPARRGPDAWVSGGYPDSSRAVQHPALGLRARQPCEVLVHACDGPASAAIRAAVSLCILLHFSLRFVRRFLLSCRFVSMRYFSLSPPDTSRVRAGKNTQRALARCVKYVAVRTRCKGRYGTAPERYREHRSAFRPPG